MSAHNGDGEGPQSHARRRAEQWMRLCLDLANKATTLGEVPVGALVVKDDKIVGQGFNLRESTQDATKHAEMTAISDACRHLGSWRLLGCELFVTLEPCIMCAGAIYQARLDRVYFGALDPKAGAMGSLYKIHEDPRLNHRLPVESRILEDECGQVLRAFFRAKRGPR